MLVEKPPIPPLAGPQGPHQGAIPSMSLQVKFFTYFGGWGGGINGV